jgi:probable FeS assembly SUF system protein SufT
MHQSNEPVAFERECEVSMIPSGELITLPEGAFGYITQDMGGSFTIFIEGNLFRLAGKDADAIGKTASIIPEIHNSNDPEEIKNTIWNQLKSCYDPEIPVNIVDLGIIYSCDITSGKIRNEEQTYEVAIVMTLTAPGCGMGPILIQDVKEKVELIGPVNYCDVELVFDPPWDQNMMSEEARLQTGLL